MIHYARVIRLIYETPWAIAPSTMQAMREVLNLRANGERFSEDEIAERIAAANAAEGRADASARPGQARQGTVAVLPLYGLLVQHAPTMEQSSSGATSMDAFAELFKQCLADPAVSSILINVDSPGGTVDGTVELADLIYSARGEKPIVAIANAWAASAAYWIGSAAGELVVTPSGQVGSIGVLAAHEDISAQQEQAGVRTTLVSAGQFKTELAPFGPLTDAARSALQQTVDAYHGMFVSAVARQRDTGSANVRENFGQGRMVLAKDAVKLGMADRIGTFDETLARMQSGNYRAPRRGQGAESDSHIYGWGSADDKRLEGIAAVNMALERMRADSFPADEAAAMDYRRRQRMRLHEALSR